MITAKKLMRIIFRNQIVVSFLYEIKFITPCQTKPFSLFIQIGRGTGIAQDAMSNLVLYNYFQTILTFPVIPGDLEH